MIMHANTRRVMSPFGKLLAAAVFLAIPMLPVLTEREADAAASPSTPKAEGAKNSTAPADAKDAKDANAKDAGSKDAAKAKPDEEQAGDQAPREQIDKEIAKARARMRQDDRKYSRQQIRDAEALYQSANKNLGDPKAKDILEEMVKKYPKLNRTGCAILYLGQRSEGKDRERYLKQAVDDFSDCFYGNGVQVGAFARYLLGHYYRDNGDAQKGNALLKEVAEKYPTSVTHKGDQLAKIAKQDMATPPPPK
jgi:hypothetical protein